VGGSYWADFREVLLATLLLGLTVAGLYRLIIGEVPWSFFFGEILGILMGISLITSAIPRPRNPRR
jgi:hypothetical protein